MLEQNFMSSMIKADGSFLGFLSRPIAGGLGVCTLALWAFMIWRGLPLRGSGAAADGAKA
jgi:putative tricarboxylic transport membrane protein